MAASTSKTRCVLCNKEKATIRCGGCLEEYCYKHWDSHRQELNKQLDEIEVNRDLFRQSLTQHNQQLNNNPLMKQINLWEQNSIQLIHQTAEEARQALLKNIYENISQTEMKLSKLTNQLRQSRDEDDFNEITLHQFQEELERLTKELTKPSNFSIQENSTSFINKISVHISESTVKSNIHHNTLWKQQAVTVAGGNGKGAELNQLNYPMGIYVDDDDDTIYIADCKNQHIVEWKCGAINGRIVAGNNNEKNETNPLDWPTDVIVNREKNNLIICDFNNRRIVQWPRGEGTNGQTIISNISCCRLALDHDGYLYVSDREKHEVRRWKIGDTNGTLVAGGNGKGNGFNQLNVPTFIFIDEDHSVYVSDYNNHRVMKWKKGAKQGIVVAGGNGEGNSLSQLSGPQGLIVDHFGTVYVADYNNHRIMRWRKKATEGNIVAGGHGIGEQANQFNLPCGLSFDRQGNLLVVDHRNHRVQKFDIDRL